MMARTLRRWWKIARRSSRREAKRRDLRWRLLRHGPPPEMLALQREQLRLLDAQLTALHRERRT